MYLKHILRIGLGAPPIKHIVKPINTLKGSVVAVTGGASGLGRGAAEWLHSMGAQVVILDLPVSDGSKVADSLGEKACFIPTDVTSQEQVASAFANIRGSFERIDTVVNCAGISYSFKVYAVSRRTKGDLKKFRQIMEVNVMGTINVMTEALDLMVENDRDVDGQRGVIINTSSIAAFEGQIGQFAYSASKGAIASMTLPLARDMSDSGIRVMTIAPGVMETPLVSALPSKVYQFMCSAVPNPNRMGTPGEFGSLVGHIVQNRYLNGSVIRLDGAWRMPP